MNQKLKLMEAKDNTSTLGNEEARSSTAYRIGKVKGLVILLSIMTLYLIALAGI